MKIAKKNGNIVFFDDEKVETSILKACAEVPEEEEISKKRAAYLAEQVFNRLSKELDVISTDDIRKCVFEILKEKGYPKTAEHYMNYKQKE